MSIASLTLFLSLHWALSSPGSNDRSHQETPFAKMGKKKRLLEKGPADCGGFVALVKIFLSSQVLLGCTKKLFFVLLKKLRKACLP